MDRNKIIIIGGDLRFVYLANLLAKENKSVSVWGINHELLSSDIKKIDNINGELEHSIIILPIPVSKDKKNIFTPFYDKTVSINEVINKINLNNIIIGGVINDKVKTKLEQFNNHIYDLANDDEFALYNAIPTGEGVVDILMHKSDITIYGSKNLILGFGKCGIIQAKILKSLGAQVGVVARNPSQLALARVNGYYTCNFDEIENAIKDYDFIINTIPAKRITEDMLIKINKPIIVIDIANQLEDKVINNNIIIINARGIPGKYSPKSASEIIYKILVEKNLLNYELNSYSD
ncbi:MAG: dipicolinate synthase subunit DpsA [Eubacteriales bacterium]